MKHFEEYGEVFGGEHAGQYIRNGNYYRFQDGAMVPVGGVARAQVDVLFDPGPDDDLPPDEPPKKKPGRPRKTAATAQKTPSA